MEAGRLDRVHIGTSGRMVEISWGERTELLFKLRYVAGCETIIAKFGAVRVSRPVELERAERVRLRAALEVWERDVLPSEGLARLLDALVQAASGGRVGAPPHA